MANSYKGNVAYIDTVSSDLDIANLMFGLSDAQIHIRKIRFYDPTAADILVLKDKSGNIVVSARALTTHGDLDISFGSDALRCQGLKLASADNTKTSGSIFIYFA